jgi:hypothetical protein
MNLNSKVHHIRSKIKILGFPIKIVNDHMTIYQSMSKLVNLKMMITMRKL